jgi:hypothetical protein
MTLKETHLLDNMNEVHFNRKVFVVRNDERTQIAFADIQNGESFELYEPDDTLVGEFVAVGDPYINEDNVWTIECDV